MVMKIGFVALILGALAWLVSALGEPEAIAPECKSAYPWLLAVGLIIVLGVWLVESVFHRDVP